MAPLLSEHPLFEQYQRLEQEIASLRAGCVLPAVPPVPLELGELFLPGPELPRFPLEQFERRRSAWELTLLPDRPVVTTDLAPDLQEELRWRRRMAERRGERRLAAVRSYEEECVAKLRAAAVRARQEALNNAGLDLKLPEREAEAAATEERKRLWDEIEAETQAARLQAEQRIAEEQARIEADTRAEISEAEASIQTRMEKRLEVFAKSGSETRERLSNAITPPQPPGGVEAATWQPAAVPSPAAFTPDYRPLLEADRRTRMAQAARLAAARAQLGLAIFEATALAVERIAGLHDWQVHLPPEEPATGPDWTERMRPEVRRMYYPEPLAQE